MFKHLQITPLVVAGCVGLVGCGGDSSKDPGDPANPGTPGISNVVEKTVTFSTNSRNCLLRHNADARVDYLIQDKQAGFLIWNCGNHDQHSRQRVRLFIAYDYEVQCYAAVSEHVDFGRCNTGTPLPDAPLFSVFISDFTVTPARNSAGVPGFRYKFALNNAGNVPAFDLSYVVAINRDVGGTQGTVEVIEPAAGYSSTEFETFSGNYSGQTFTLDLTVRDPFGVPVARAFRRSVTVP